MKRTLKFLAWLYPPRWRKRYGAEFEALLEDATPSARDALDLLWGAFKMQITSWSFGRITLAGSVVGILVAAAFSFAVPVHYLSHVVVTVTPAEGSAPESTSVQVANVERYAFSREALTSIIQEHNLYPHERAHMAPDDVIDKMRKSISVYPLMPASPKNRDAFSFAVQFDYSDPHVAQQVNAELTSRVIEGNLRMRLHSLSIISQVNPGSMMGGGVFSSSGPVFQFMVLDPPTLPLKPSSPNRTQFAAVGLFAGLLAGLSLAIAVRPRRTTTAGNG
jgi:hypothetical protein